MNDAWALLIETFRQEATELLDELAQTLERQRDGTAEPSALTAARRIAHNLKGAALSVGASRITEPCHTLEDEFERVADEGIPPAAERIEEWLHVVTELQRAVEDPSLIPTPDTTPSPESAAKEPNQTPAAPAETTIRVDVRRIDAVLEEVSEVALTQARVTQLGAEISSFQQELEQALKANAPIDDLLSALGRLAHGVRAEGQEFGYLVDRMRTAMNQVRMTPISNMAPLWQRTIRDSAHELDRPTQLELSVGDVEADLHLCELLKDALLHILRNAVAHGIESVQERLAKGKARVGRVRIEARADGSHVQLDVSDDGRGIDPARVAARAVERGWMTTEAVEAMSDAERCALIFSPGLSTADVVTTIAGRGMGLYAVRRNIEELGGTVSVSSAPGLGGTLFTLRMPASILSVKGLLVRSGTVVYALPLHDVAQVAKVVVSELEQSEGHPVFRDAEGRPTRVRRLDTLLGRRTTQQRLRSHLVVLRRPGQALAVVVDDVLGEREFVTRPLPWNLEAAWFNGALILPDGAVALSLDTGALFVATQIAESSPIDVLSEQNIRSKRVLVVDDSVSVRTLESQTLSSAGYEVAVFPDGRAAWTALQRESFDLVVSDVQMPEMDGLELTTRIRKSETLRHLPVVLVTGLDAADDVKRGADAGADEYIVKGQLDQEKLLRAVRRLLH
jgi:two-component system chemotaxis sensor kinase CheA